MRVACVNRICGASYKLKWSAQPGFHLLEFEGGKPIFFWNFARKTPANSNNFSKKLKKDFYSHRFEIDMYVCALC